MHTAPAISGTPVVSGKPAFAASCQIAKPIPAITGNRMNPTKMRAHLRTVLLNHNLSAKSSLKP